MSGERELYDLARDPDELTSLHADPRYARTQAESRAPSRPRCAAAPARCAGRARSSASRGGSSEAGTAGARESSSRQRPFAQPHLEHGLLSRRASAQARPARPVHRLRPEADRPPGRLTSGGARDAQRLAAHDTAPTHRRLPSNRLAPPDIIAPVRVATHRAPHLVFGEHEFDVPLDHASPERGKLTVFAREVVSPEASATSCRGSSSSRAARAASRRGRSARRQAWLARAVEDYRVLLLDQRGTGRSTPVGDLTG